MQEKFDELKKAQQMIHENKSSVSLNSKLEADYNALRTEFIAQHDLVKSIANLLDSPMSEFQIDEIKKNEA